MPLDYKYKSRIMKKRFFYQLNMALAMATIVLATACSSDEGEVTPEKPKSVVVNLEVSTPPTKVTYEIGDVLDYSGIEVTLTYSSDEGVTTDSTVVVPFDKYKRYRLEFDPENGLAAELEMESVMVSVYGSDSTDEFGISVNEPGGYVPTAMAFPDTWGENGVYFVSNFIGIEQVDGGNANNDILAGAWVWAGGDFKEMSTVDLDTYSFLHLVYGEPVDTWAAWMFGGDSFGLTGSAADYKFVADVRCKGKWLVQLVGKDADEVEHTFSAGVEFKDENGVDEETWREVEIPFDAFGDGAFDVTILNTMKIAAEHTVTTGDDYIDITNVRFVAK